MATENVTVTDRVDLLLGLIDFKLAARQRIKALDKIENINGYDTVFILSALIRNKFSGYLIIVDDSNELTGVTFAAGEVTKIDYPEQEAQVVATSADKQLSAPSPQLQIYKQVILRLVKYLNSSSVKINFSFDSSSVKPTDTGLTNPEYTISGVTNSGRPTGNSSNYYDVLHTVIFGHYKAERLQKYHNFYSKKIFLVNISESDYSGLKSIESIWQSVGKVKNSSKKTMTFDELTALVSLQRDGALKLVHFMVLTGLLVVVQNEAIKINHPGAKGDIMQSAAFIAAPGSLASDFKKTKEFLLNRKYLEAFGIMNKHSSLIASDVQVRFYFIWVKLHGAFYNNYLLDLKKITVEISEISEQIVGPSDYHYVRALLEASKKNKEGYISYYNKAVAQEPAYARFPISKDAKLPKSGVEVSFLDKILKAIGL